MKIEFVGGAQIRLTQNLTGDTATFTGVELGRAYLNTGADDTSVTIAAAKKGTYGNSLSVVFKDPGFQTASTVAKVLNNQLQVILRHDGTEVVATAEEVISAINNLQSGIGTEFWASGGEDRSGVVSAVGSTNLAHGLDPVSGNGKGTFVFESASADGGLFYFEANKPVTINAVSIVLSSSTAYVVDLVELNTDFTVKSTFRRVASGTGQYVSLSNVAVLNSLQAIKVTAADTGAITVTAVL